MTTCARLSRTPGSPGPLRFDAIGRHSLEDLILVVRGEFNEMPGMRLTQKQFQRLWNLTQTECDWLMGRLIASGFLTRTGDWIGRPVDL